MKTPKTKATTDSEKLDLVRDALKVYDDWNDFEKHNIEAGYDDLEFRAGNQWPLDIERERTDEGRPCEIVNQMGQYVRQVTGDMRQMRPAIKVIPIDDSGDEEKAEARAGVVRYIEARSDAPAIYFQGADSQVTCGIGAWRIDTEYASGTTFNQEIRISPIEDALAVAWDLDAKLPTREDAMRCVVPFDISRSKYEELYPDFPIAEFSTPTDNSTLSHIDWSTADTVRIAEYWYKKAVKKTLALKPDGSVINLDEVSPEEARAFTADPDVRIEKRDDYKVCRALVTSRDVIEEPKEWPGAYIPIVPVIGEEIRIGKRVVRHGIVRFAKGPQRLLNYNVSAETEAVALQPKAPFTGTEKNFEQYQDVWENANRKNFPYLPYTPDPANGNQAPQRVQPAVSSQGFSSGIERAERHIQTVIGIYNSSLGAQSNETSGKAVLARQREGDTGTFVLIDNWTRAIRYTGKILVDLIPKIYDTARMLRIVGEDGKIEELPINQVGGMGPDGEPILTNDVTIGSYDVSIEMGPSYSTKRAEAKDGMGQLIQSVPDMFPLIGDLFVKAQDWPMADKISERLALNLPPAIKQMEAEDGAELPQLPPDPAQEAAMQVEQGKQQLEAAKLQVEQMKLQVEAERIQFEREKMQFELAKMQMASAAPAQPVAQPAPGPDPVEAMQMDLMKTRAMKELDFEFEARRKKLDRDGAQASELGMSEDDAEPSEMGPSPIEMLAQALAMQGQAIQSGLAEVGAGMQMLAQAQSAPKRVVRGADGRVAGVEAVN